MIKLTRVYPDTPDPTFYVNPSSIAALYPVSVGTVIRIDRVTFTVRETPDDIAKQVNTEPNV